VTFPATPTVAIGDVPAEFSPDVVLLDVREPDEWEQGHAPGAVHIPMTDVPARIADLDMDAEVYVICRQGGRSARVVDYLNQVGFDAVNVDGGMVAWQMAGRPLVAYGGREATIF
jgi:rhodanese-related sulfurtransferase